jgi:hypothetical protein
MLGNALGRWCHRSAVRSDSGREDGSTRATSGLLGTSGPAGGQHTGAGIRAAATQLSLSTRVVRVPCPQRTLASPPEPISKRRFRCGGTRARAKRVRGGLNVAACICLAASGPRGSIFARGPLGQRGLAGPADHTWRAASLPKSENQGSTRIGPQLNSPPS